MVKMPTPARQLFRLDYDGSDAWGSVMSHWFAVAGVLYINGGEIPREWAYKPGIEPCPEGHWPDEEYLDLFDSGELTLEDLTLAGRVLDRYAALLVAQGRDY